LLSTTIQKCQPSLEKCSYGSLRAAGSIYCVNTTCFLLRFCAA
jgi:hypothetical protein